MATNNYYCEKCGIDHHIYRYGCRCGCFTSCMGCGGSIQSGYEEYHCCHSLCLKSIYMDKKLKAEIQKINYANAKRLGYSSNKKYWKIINNEIDLYLFRDFK
jgi:hypothetical protein